MGLIQSPILYIIFLQIHFKKYKLKRNLKLNTNFYHSNGILVFFFVLVLLKLTFILVILGGCHREYDHTFYFVTAIVKIDQFIINKFVSKKALRMRNLLFNLLNLFLNMIFKFCNDRRKTNHLFAMFKNDIVIFFFSLHNKRNVSF